jgi:hypothetical protein
MTSKMLASDLSMTNWLPITSAPRDGYTHILVLYERHSPMCFTKTPSGKLKPTTSRDFGMEVNQAVFVPDKKQWRIFYQPVMFEPFCGQINSNDVLGWMPLPRAPKGSGAKMHRKQQAYYKRRDARWRKAGILKD